MIALALTLLASPSPALQALPAGRVPVPKRRHVTWVTGELPGMDVIFKVVFNPRMDGADVSIAVVEGRSFAVDGIDFLPGTLHALVGAPVGKITHYDLESGATLPDFIPVTDAIAVPPAGPGTHPSTVLATPAHLYYVENQFGFGATPSHRIIRKFYGGGPEELVFDGAPFLENFEGLEIVAGRLYSFAKDPGMPMKRALLSIGLTPGGLWDGMPPALHLTGLTAAPVGDGSDELDFDSFSGLLFGTNIVNGEIVAWDPFGASEVSSPGAAHFVDGVQIAASAGALGVLDGAIDGIRSIHNGWLIVTGKGGVIATIDVAGVLADGADDGDVRVQVFMPGAVSFDDLTPVVATPVTVLTRP
jgi:hypothetical protein